MGPATEGSLRQVPVARFELGDRSGVVGQVEDVGGRHDVAPVGAAGWRRLRERLRRRLGDRGLGRFVVDRRGRYRLWHRLCCDCFECRRRFGSQNPPLSSPFPDGGVEQRSADEPEPADCDRYSRQGRIRDLEATELLSDQGEAGTGGYAAEGGRRSGPPAARGHRPHLTGDSAKRQTQRGEPYQGRQWEPSRYPNPHCGRAAISLSFDPEQSDAVRADVVE